MITAEREDIYGFRTPSLRDLTMTNLYGHNDGCANRDDIMPHHLDGVKGLASYDRSKAVIADSTVADDWNAMGDFGKVRRIAEATEISDVALVEEEIDQIMAFLGALTDKGEGNRGLRVPHSVSLGLKVDAVLPPS